MENICVIGSGYVGLITAVGLAETGRRVIGVDIDRTKIHLLNRGKAPIYEPGLEECLTGNLRQGRISFTADPEEAIKNSRIVIIAVGTSPDEKGNIDLSHIETAIRTVYEKTENDSMVVIKSTVPPGTTRRLYDSMKRKYPQKHCTLFYMPEFLREGCGMEDFFHPDRLVIGCEKKSEAKTLISLYEPLNHDAEKFILCDFESAEFAKLAANAFLATKLSFINQIADLTESKGGNIDSICRILGTDSRIGPEYLRPGPGFGGSCLPKDTTTLSRSFSEAGIESPLTEKAVEINERRKEKIFKKICSAAGGKEGLRGKVVALLGLAFKADTDDMRESVSLYLLERLLESEAVIQAHDPRAGADINKLYPHIHFARKPATALENSDILIVMTEWEEYKKLDLAEVRRSMRGNVIVDGRNIMDAGEARRLGFTYVSMGNR
jgi:UDPglucose 6-dehydrogenase